MDARRRFWTTGELARLTYLYPDTPMAMLVGMFDRPASAIYTMARRLELRRSFEFLAGEHSGRIRTGSRRGFETRLKKAHSK